MVRFNNEFNFSFDPGIILNISRYHIAVILWYDSEIFLDIIVKCLVISSTILKYFSVQFLNNFEDKRSTESFIRLLPLHEFFHSSYLTYYPPLTYIFNMSIF